MALWDSTDDQLRLQSYSVYLRRAAQDMREQSAAMRGHSARLLEFLEERRAIRGQQRQDLQERDALK